MKLAILIGRFPPGALGGAEHQAEGWALRLSDRHRVTVVTRRESPGERTDERRDGFDLIRLPVGRFPVVRAFQDAANIARVVESLDPRPDALLCFQTFVSGYAGVRIQKRTGIPALVWIRGEGEYRLAQSPGARAMHPAVWRDARTVLIQTEEGGAALLRELERHAPAVRRVVEPKLVVVPNGLDLPERRAVTPPPPRGPILSVGRLIPEKGMDLAIDAALALSAPLTLAGAGPERARLEARANHARADVRFAGFVPHASLARLYAESRCVVLAARHGEGLPNALLEAMAWGRPVVATPVAGVRGLVRDGENGLVVPAEAGALAAALRRLGDEPDLAARLGAGARATAESYAWANVRPRLETVLEWCVA